MKKYLSIILVSASLCTTGCSSFPFLYRVPVQQGNIVTQEMVSQLRPGMTAEQVRYIMGEPILVNGFNPQRWEYIYTLTPSKGKYERRLTTLYFSHQTLLRWDTK